MKSILAVIALLLFFLPACADSDEQLDVVDDGGEPSSTTAGNPKAYDFEVLPGALIVSMQGDGVALFRVETAAIVLGQELGLEDLEVILAVNGVIAYQGPLLAEIEFAALEGDVLNIRVRVKNRQDSREYSYKTEISRQETQNQSLTRTDDGHDREALTVRSAGDDGADDERSRLEAPLSHESGGHKKSHPNPAVER